MSKQGKEIAIINHGPTRAERSSGAQVAFKSEARCSSLLQAVANKLAN